MIFLFVFFQTVRSLKSFECFAVTSPPSTPAALHFSGGRCTYNQQCCAARCVGDSEHESSAFSPVQQVLEQAVNSSRARHQVYLLIVTPERKG